MTTFNSVRRFTMKRDGQPSQLRRFGVAGLVISLLFVLVPGPAFAATGSAASIARSASDPLKAVGEPKCAGINVKTKSGSFPFRYDCSHRDLYRFVSKVTTSGSVNSVQRAFIVAVAETSRSNPPLKFGNTVAQPKSASAQLDQYYAAIQPGNAGCMRENLLGFIRNNAHITNRSFAVSTAWAAAGKTLVGPRMAGAKFGAVKAQYQKELKNLVKNATINAKQSNLSAFEQGMLMCKFS